MTKSFAAEIPSGFEGDELGKRAAAFLDTSVLVSPGWKRKVYQSCLQPALERGMGFHEIRRLYRELVEIPMDGAVLAERVLRALTVRWEIPEADKDHLRSLRGPQVIVANHPFGALDFFAISLLLEEIWPESWRFLGNEAMGAIPGFEQRLIPLDPLGVTSVSRRLNQKALRTALSHLRANGVLGLFPAGRVSHRHPELGGAVADRAWSAHATKLARAGGAGLVCLYIAGQNSGRFLRVPPAWPRLRALFLCRELIRPPVSAVRIGLAAHYPADTIDRLGSPESASGKIRADCYAWGDRNGRLAGASFPEIAAVSLDREQLRFRQKGLGTLIAEFPVVLASGKFELRLMHGDSNARALEELGRLREHTFRLAGQGTGKTVDLSAEDTYYWHLLLWDSEDQKLAGAYRIGMVDEVVRQHGLGGLYLAHVFRIQRGFLGRIGRGAELSRSFVAPDYQRSPGALAALWKGLGAIVRQEGIETLFGSVTISNVYHPVSRAILVEFLRQNYSDDPAWSRRVRARQPYHTTGRYHRLVASAYVGETLEKLDPLIRRLEDGKRGVPVLMRYYQSLGARYLDYHVERDFQNALYCLLRVEVAAIPASFRHRFIG